MRSHPILLSIAVVLWSLVLLSFVLPDKPKEASTPEVDALAITTTVVTAPDESAPGELSVETPLPTPIDALASASEPTSVPTPAPATTAGPAPTTAQTSPPATHAPPTNAPAPPAGPVSVNDSALGSGLNQIQYTGSWAVSNGAGRFQNDEHNSDQVGASYAMSFKGTSVSLFGSKDANYGKASVKIDDFPSMTIDFFGAARANNVEVFRRGGLANGNHKITVTVLGTNSAGNGHVVTLDRFVVSP